MTSPTTLIIGASPKPQRYAYKALIALQSHQHSIALFSPKGGEIEGVAVHSDLKKIKQAIDTVTLYVNPSRLSTLIDDIIALAPRRVIFNPGTESIDATRAFEKAGIQTTENCTLIMLREATF